MSESLDLTGSGLLQRLVDLAGDAWTDAADHRFVSEVRGNTLNDPAWHRYLIVEWQFIDTAARCLGRAVHIAPSLAHRRRLAAGLYALTTEQIDFFHTAADQLGLDLNTALPPAAEVSARKLHDRSLGYAAAGDYTVLLGSMYASEILYLAWCKEVDTARLEPSLRTWIEMHQGGAFEDHCLQVESELWDQIGSLDSAAFQSAAAAFTETLRGEVGLHDAVYLWND